MPTLETKATPRPLDPSVVAAKPLVMPPMHRVDKPVVVAPESAKLPIVAAPKESRDPATGHVRYDHARDYSWVVGQLQYLHSKQQWRVRYSPYDVDDELGGAITLVGVDHLRDGLQNGMSVRIQGQLVNPESKKGSPEYQVYDLKTIQ